MDEVKLDLITKIVARYRKNHSEDWEKWEAVKRLRKEELQDEKFGQSSLGAMRFAANIPLALHKQIMVVYPDYIDTKENADSFLKHFPVFKIAIKL